ncbi:DNA-binding response OmpR family regulator [Brevundimonas vesicularis]|uniref:DNA-binding response OmpR family regulator n=1 Tax=Brevundimonas vesicularis TaxID=41276 RepID=A0A7W9FU50_BREVE|nr:response regulator [Brevundimonas vesicularis]MBB5771526.1 DNA-binding response OmpR family regulator [Brevundimonas vesicularis]
MTSATDHRPHCLIVEDDPVLLDAMGRGLTQAGYNVALARDGAQALVQFEQVAAQLVITDILMPEKEGVETIMALRARAPEVRIIAISGGGRAPAAGFLDLARRLGADATLAKPFAMTLLIDLAASLAPVSVR